MPMTRVDTIKSVVFATGNHGKAKTLERYLKHHNIMVRVVPRSLDIIEPQADTAEEIALMKGRQAYQQVHGPVLVDDSSFHIDALGGFPGPYIKYMLTTIGIDGIMAFMEGQTNRKAHFLSCLVYIDEKGNEHIFTDEPFRGSIAERADTYVHPEEWSPLWLIFIPEGLDKTLSQLSASERMLTSVKREENDAYAKFCGWLKSSQ